MNREFMNGLTSPDDPRPIGKPFAYEIDGRPVDVATNGHALLIVDQATYPKADTPPKIETALPCHWAKSKTVDFAELQKWALAGGPYWEECHRCGGERTMFCHECERDGAECMWCIDPRGIPAEAEPVLFLGVMINRRLLGEYLRNLTAESVVISAGASAEDAVGVTAESWRVLVMPLRRRSDNETELSSFPPEGN